MEVTVTGVRNARGHVLAAVCPQADFLTARCPFHAGSPARPGTVVVRVSGVPAGTWAVQAWHDENDNLQIDRNFIGLPTEGIGFSNDAPFRFGPPSFADAAFRMGAAGARIALRLRYLTD